jgi:hypothetical protein
MVWLISSFPTELSVPQAGALVSCGGTNVTDDNEDGDIKLIVN